MSLFLPRTPRLRLALALADGAWLAVAGWLAHVVRFSAGVERVAKLHELLSHPAPAGDRLRGDVGHGRRRGTL